MSDVNRQVVETLEAALLLTDAEGRVLLANERATSLLGRDLTGARLGTDPFEDDPPIVEAIAMIYRRAAQANGTGRELIAATDEAGSRFYWVTVTRANDGAGGDGRLIAVLDISEPVMEAPSVRRVFSQINHDLRSPLTSISGAAELLLSGRVGSMEPVQRRLVTIVEEGTRKMSAILARTKAELVQAEATAGGEALE